MTDVSKLPPASTLYEYEFHELAARFNLIEGEEYDALIDSIERQGLLNPITLYQGKVLDGRNRYRAAKAAKYKFSERDFVELSSGRNPKAFVLDANVKRRHLNTEQKRTLVIQLFREMPHESDRRIALLTGVSNKSVSTYRKELEEDLAEFAKSWRKLDDVQRREFVRAHRDELQRVGCLNGGAV